MSSGTAPVGATILHYHVLERLGGGAMGEVYLAEDMRLGRRVALKFLAPGLGRDPEARERLLREARAAAVLRSPHIAVTYDLAEHDGALFIAMEYVAGELLSERIARGRLPPGDAVDIALQLADALDEAHANGVVHRDIKSANVILTERQLVKVLDFGLAKFVAPPAPDLGTLAAATLPGLVLGTLGYMAPEQLRGEEIDHRADLFSSGVVLYEMLAGRRPFAGVTIAEVADALLHRDPPPIQSVRHDVPPAIETILRRALQKHPDVRYQSAREFYADLLHARRTALDGSRRSSDWLTPIDFTDAASPLPVRPQPRVRPHPPVVAVLSFANITGSAADDWIGSGIAESLTADLARLRPVSVVPREQIFELQRSLTAAGREMDERQAIEIGRRLGASVMVGGAYQRLGDRIRITSQAVDVLTGRQKFAVKIDGRLDDLFDLQDRLVTELISALRVAIGEQERAALETGGTGSLEAFQAYSRGMVNVRLGDRDSMDRGIALLEQAIAIDPHYVDALVRLGGALELKALFTASPALLARSLELVDRALALRPDDADAHVQRGDTLLALGRADEAIAALQQGIHLTPGRASAHASLARAYWLGKGQVDAAIREFEEALRLNPEAGYAHLQLAMLYSYRGDEEAAERVALGAIRLQDKAMSGATGLIVVGAHTRLGYVRYRQGRYAEALREYRRELELLAVSDHLLRERTSIELHQKIAAAHRRLGDVETAAFHEELALEGFRRRLAAGADEPFTRYYMAALHALRGEAALAREHLDLPLARVGEFTRWRLPRDPDFDGMKQHSLFAQLLSLSAPASSPEVG